MSSAAPSSSPLPDQRFAAPRRQRDAPRVGVHDELRERRVERAVGVGQVFRSRKPNIDTGMPRACCSNERLRRVDSRHRVRPEPPDELGRQCARPAANVEHCLSDIHAREVGKPGRQLCRIPPHEAVISIRSDIEEAHAPTLGHRPV